METNIINGDLVAKNMQIAIVVARFNDFINNKLLEGALDCYKRHGGDLNTITTLKVPGAFEIPLVCQKLAEQKKYDGIVALGTIIRGATAHFNYVANEVSKGIAQISWNFGIPIGFGILTTENIEQAIERAGTKAGNKGSDAMITTIEMIDLLQKI